MSDQSLFGSPNPEATPQNQNTPPGNGGNQNQNDELVNQLMVIKNEFGQPKYKTVQEALNALKHSQEYIPTLKSELDKLKAENEALKAGSNKLQELENTVLELSRQNLTKENQPQGISEERIAELVSSQLTKAQQEEAKKNNLNLVVQKVKEIHGDKAEEYFYGKAQELGMSKAEINELAAKTPKAVLNLLGVSAVPNQMRSTPMNLNTAGFQPPNNSAITKNAKSVMMGASSEDVQIESQNSKNLIEELHAAGLTMQDLSDPKVYKKYFK